MLEESGGGLYYKLISRVGKNKNRLLVQSCLSVDMDDARVVSQIRQMSPKGNKNGQSFVFGPPRAARHHRDKEASKLRIILASTYLSSVLLT
jgi:hypothetical protein